MTTTMKGPPPSVFDFPLGGGGHVWRSEAGRVAAMGVSRPGDGEPFVSEGNTASERLFVGLGAIADTGA